MSTLNLWDPRNPGLVESFPVTPDFTENLCKHYKRKIVGLFDSTDRVYFPTRFILLNPAYFASREQLVLLSDVNISGRIEATTSLSSIELDVSGSIKDENLTTETARRIFSAIDLKNSGRVLQTYMSTYLTAAFEYLFRVLKESSAVCTPAELAALVTSSCFISHGNPKDLDFKQFSSWLLSVGDTPTMSMKSLMSKAVEIYCRPSEVMSRGQDQQTFQGNVSTLNLREAIDQMKKVTGLYKYRVSDIIRFFLTQSDASNCLDRESFSNLFQHICGDSELAENRDSFIDSLFRAFDYEGNEFVNLVDFGNCLPLFCSGSRVEMASVVFQLADSDHNGVLTPRELFLYLRSTTHFLFQISNEVSNLHPGKSPDEIAWSDTVEAFKMNKKTITSAEYEDLDDAPESLNFNEFEKWYFFSSSLHSAAWEEAVKSSEALTEDLDQRFSEEFDNFEDKVEINIRSMKSIFPLGQYTAAVLVDFFFEVSDEDGSLNESTFYSAFDKLLQTKKTPPKAAISTYDELSLDISIARIFSTFEERKTGKVHIFDLLCALLVFSGDTPVRRAQVVLGLVQSYFYGDNKFDDDYSSSQYVLENDMAAALLPVIKILLAFSPASGGCSPEYLTATLTVEALATASKMTVLGGDECINSDVFCNWLTSIFDLIDEDRFPEITSENQSAFVKEVRRRVTCTVTIDSDCNDSENEEIDEDIATDQSLNCDDSATLTSGVISISTSIIDELETTKSVLGLPNVFVEDVMDRLGRKLSSGKISRRNFLEAMVGSSEKAGLHSRYIPNCIELASAIFRCFDISNTGFAEYSELLSGVSVLTDSSASDKITASFFSMDKSNRGELEISKVRSIFCSMLKVICLCSGSARDHLMQLSSQNLSETDTSDLSDLAVMVFAVETVSGTVLDHCIENGLLSNESLATLDQVLKIIEEFQALATNIPEIAYSL